MKGQTDEKKNLLTSLKNLRSWRRHHLFGAGLILGVITGSMATSSYLSLTNEQTGISGTQSVSTFSTTPRIFRVIPESASPGDEIVIRGGKFGSRGKVCFRNCSSEFEVLSWTSGSVRARVSQVATGSGELWVVDGQGMESSEISFEVE